MNLLYKLCILVTLVFGFSFAKADPWESHKEEVQELEHNIIKYEQELGELVEKKKKTRDKVRIEETLQRIVEIHAELISLRKSMDTLAAHLKVEHPEKAHILDDYDSRKRSRVSQSGRFKRSPITKQLDQLLIKVQVKYASFMKVDDKKEAVQKVEKVVQKKKKEKREREADVYLRRRSKVKLVK